MTVVYSCVCLNKVYVLADSMACKIIESPDAKRTVPIEDVEYPKIYQHNNFLVSFCGLESTVVERVKKLIKLNVKKIDELDDKYLEYLQEEIQKLKNNELKKKAISTGTKFEPKKFKGKMIFVAIQGLIIKKLDEDGELNLAYSHCMGVGAKASALIAISKVLKRHLTDDEILKVVV